MTSPDKLMNVRGKFLFLMVCFISFMIIPMIIAEAIITIAFVFNFYLLLFVLCMKKLVVNFLLFKDSIEEFVNSVSLKYVIQLLKLSIVGKLQSYSLKRLVNFFPNSFQMDGYVNFLFGFLHFGFVNLSNHIFLQC